MVEFEIKYGHDGKIKSEVYHTTCNPHMYESFRFEIPVNDLGNQTLTFKVIDMMKTNLPEPPPPPEPPQDKKKKKSKDKESKNMPEVAVGSDAGDAEEMSCYADDYDEFDDDGYEPSIGPDIEDGEQDIEVEGPGFSGILWIPSKG